MSRLLPSFLHILSFCQILLQSARQTYIYEPHTMPIFSKSLKFAILLAINIPTQVVHMGYLTDWITYTSNTLRTRIVDKAQLLLSVARSWEGQSDVLNTLVLSGISASEATLMRSEGHRQRAPTCSDSAVRDPGCVAIHAQQPSPMAREHGGIHAAGAPFCPNVPQQVARRLFVQDHHGRGCNIHPYDRYGPVLFTSYQAYRIVIMILDHEIPMPARHDDGIASWRYTYLITNLVAPDARRERFKGRVL